MAIVTGRVQPSPVRPAGRRASTVSEPAPERGPFAERVTYAADGAWLLEDRVVVFLNAQRGFRSESQIMRWLRRDKTPLRSAEELYAQYLDQFKERREAASHNSGAGQ